MKNDKSSETAKDRLLIIDDDLDATLSIAQQLKLIGYEVHCQPTSRKATNAGEEITPTVILCNMNISRPNSCEFCPFIRRQRWDKNIQLIALTSRCERSITRQARRSNSFEGFLLKPVESKALLWLLVDRPAPKSCPKQSAHFSVSVAWKNKLKRLLN